MSAHPSAAGSGEIGADWTVVPGEKSGPRRRLFWRNVFYLRRPMYEIELFIKHSFSRDQTNCPDFSRIGDYFEGMGILSSYSASRYIVPLREGGSLPAIVEVDGGGLFVAKFRGAGQGARALTAEVIVGELARRLGLPVPEIAIIDLGESFGQSEPDPEIQDLLKGSRGTNIGLRFIEEAFTYDPVAFPEISPDLAADIVWLDAYTMNVDRTPRNTNMLLSAGALWLIDHGAALYFHHNWAGADPSSTFTAIHDHVLLPLASDLAEADRRLAPRLTRAVLEDVLAMVPDELLMDSPRGIAPPFPTAADNRNAYVAHLTRRLAPPRGFVEQAERARQTALTDRPVRKEYRR